MNDRKRSLSIIAFPSLIHKKEVVMTNEIVFRPVDSLQMMAYIIKRCDDLGVELNITKLQKLMYCCYGTVLGRFDQRLIDEFPAAWQYGPVFPEALRAAQFFQVSGFRDKDTPEANELPNAVRGVIDQTLVNFGKFSAKQLSDWTHIKGSPWYRASDGGMVLYGRLDDNNIKEYFRAHVLL